MIYQKCIINNQYLCIGREKFHINGKLNCCHEELADEISIAQSIVDTIEDFFHTADSISKICSRISYATDVISTKGNPERDEIFYELKRFSVLVYEHQERIIEEPALLDLTGSFINFVKGWFDTSFLNNTLHLMADNCLDSIRADLHMLEMSLGICTLMPVAEESLDDIFF